MARRAALIPNLRFLSLKGSSPDSQDISDDHFYQYQSQITELTLENCALSQEQLGDLLENIEALQSFSYINPDCGFGYCPPFSIRTALLAHARCPLKSLTLIHPSEKARFSGTFRNFTSLESIKCEQALLMCEYDNEATGEKMLPSSIKTVELFDRRCQRSDSIG